MFPSNHLLWDCVKQWLEAEWAPNLLMFNSFPPGLNQLQLPLLQLSLQWKLLLSQQRVHVCVNVVKWLPWPAVSCCWGKTWWNSHGGIFEIQLRAAILLVQLQVRAVEQHQEKKKMHAWNLEASQEVICPLVLCCLCIYKKYHGFKKSRRCLTMHSGGKNTPWLAIWINLNELILNSFLMSSEFQSASLFCKKDKHTVRINIWYLCVKLMNEY